MDDAREHGSDMGRLLKELAPAIRPGEFVFVDGGDPLAADIPPERVEALVREPEGITLVTKRRDADVCGLGYDFVAAWIVLGVDSALDSVGLTAAVAACLADNGISCNVLAGLRHDHLLVPHASSRKALSVLVELGRGAGRA